MKILLAPSETKHRGGDEAFEICDLLLNSICEQRKELFQGYINILSDGNITEIDHMFGLKSSDEVDYYRSQNYNTAPTMKAIERYTGVAFDYLDYPSLQQSSRDYLDNNLLIFSNLFGVLAAGDKIPDYRLKQGSSIGDIKTDRYFRPIIKEPLDTLLADEDILDIRAGYYDKFYKPSKSYTTLKFIKDGKVVSHWAKAYRGIVLREIAKARVSTVDEFMSLSIQSLEVVEIHNKGNKTEVFYNILETEHS